MRWSFLGRSVADPDQCRLAVGEGRGVDSGKKARIALTPKELSAGLYITGCSRSGKSNLLKHLACQCLDQNVPFTLIDIEGGLYSHLLAYASQKAPKRPVRFLDPTDDSEGVIPLNLLAGPQSSLFTRVQALVGVFRRVWPDSFDQAARMRAILTSSFLALGEQGFSLAEFDRLVLDADFALDLAAVSANPSLLAFWTQYRKQLSRYHFTSWVESSRNKLYDLLSSPYIGPSLQCDSCINLLEATTVIRLDEGRLQDHLKLYATLLVALLELQSAERPEGSPPHLLFLDEMQEFPTSSIHRLFSRRQKRGVGMILAHQNLKQIDPVLLSDIIGNCEHRVIFKLGDIKDAIWAAEQVFDLRGDRVKHQDTERIFGIFKIPKGNPVYWSRSDEHVHFARELQLQKPGQCVFHGLSTGQTYFVNTPLVPPCPAGRPLPSDGLVQRDVPKRTIEQRQERIAELSTERRKAAVARKRSLRTRPVS